MTDLTTGTTVYLLSGSKYKGRYDLLEVGTPDANGWQHIKADMHWSVKNHASQEHDGTSIIEWHTRTEDAFATEAEARQAARERRSPRRQQMTPYGDYGQLAALLRANR